MNKKLKLEQKTKLLKRVLYTIWVITLFSVIGLIFNLLFMRYNPFPEYKVLSNKEKYLTVDTLIILDEGNFSGDITSSDGLSYFVHGKLKNERLVEKNLIWTSKKYDEPWQYFKDTILANGKIDRYVPVYKSKIVEEIYPVYDLNYINYERLKSLLGIIFFTFPLWSIPLMIILSKVYKKQSEIIKKIKQDEKNS